MAKMIFQAFVLRTQDENEAKKNQKENNQTEKTFRGPWDWRAAVRKLKKSGFIVLCSQTVKNGLPTEVFLGWRDNAPLRRNVKDIFYRIAGEFSLPYRSGDWYAEE